jgi:hypothetical protein
MKYYALLEYPPVVMAIYCIENVNHRSPVSPGRREISGMPIHYALDDQDLCRSGK